MNSTPRPSSSEPNYAASGNDTLDVLFAGLHFRVEGKREQLRCFEQLRHVRSPLPGECVPIGHVRCALQSAPPSPRERRGGQPIEWSWQGRHGRVQTRHFRAQLARLGPRQFELQAGLAIDAQAASTLLSAVVPPLLHALGGTVLHAASVEVAGRAVAFVGPSGAGKSTACRHVAGASWYSLDRLAVAPVAAPSKQGAYVASPLPGGKPWEGDTPGSTRPQLPLAAILRVVQSSPGPRLAHSSAQGRLSLLRQAAVHGDRSAPSELELLGALEALGRDVAVGTMEFALGDELWPGIERFLLDRATT